MLRNKTNILVSISHISHGRGYIRCLKNVRTIGILSTFSLLILVSLCFFPIANHEEKAEATPVDSITNLDIALGKGTAKVEIIPNNAGGTFRTSPLDEEASFSVTTNNLTGYEVSLAARSGDTSGQLINADYGGVLNPIIGITTESNFSSYTAFTNQWGIKPSKYNSVVNTDQYIPAPTNTTGFIIDQTDGPNSTANTYTIGVGARVDYTKPSGTYTNTYVLQAISRPVAYEVLYLDGSSGSDVEVVTRDTGPNAISKIQLSTTRPTRATYAFNKWCSVKPTYPTDGSSVCTGTTYNPGDDFTPTTGVGAQNKLYAMWNVVTFDQAYLAAGKSKVSGYSYFSMQEMTSSICATITNGQTSTLLDNRVATSSGTTKYSYTVAKINGGCWMTQNLAFGWNSTSANGGSVDYYDMTLSTDTTNTNTNKTIRFYDYTGAHGSVSATTPGCTAVSGNGADPSTASGAGFSTPCVHSGNANEWTGNKRTMWYNFNAATTGLISGPSNSNNVNYDLCPKGWRLPQDYATASKVIPYKTLFNPVYGGLYGNNGNHTWEDMYGAWWSAQASNTNTRYYIINKNATYSVPTDGYRNAGLYIRCIAK